MLLVVDNRSHFLQDLKVCLRELGSGIMVRSAGRQIPPEDLGQAEGIILSGGPLLLDRGCYLKEIALDLEVVIEARVPILGICLGHQLVAEAYGSGILRCSEFINRQVSIRVLKRDPLFSGLPDTFLAWEAHAEAIAGLPDPFEHLATSEICRYEAIRHRHRPVYGVQFHPEASGATGTQILRNFLTICGEAAA